MRFQSLFVLAIVLLLVQSTSTLKTKVFLKRTAAEILGIPNLLSSGSSSSSGVTNLNLINRGGSSTNENTSTTNLIRIGSAGTGANLGRSVSEMIGTGTIRTVTTGSNSVALGQESAASASENSSANAVDVLSGTGRSGTTSGSESATEVGTNTGRELSNGTTLTEINGDGTGAAATEGTGATLIEGNRGAGISETSTGGALIVNAGEGKMTTSNEGGTALTFGKSSADSSTVSNGTLHIIGQGTGTTTSTSNTSVSIEGEVAKATTTALETVPNAVSLSSIDTNTYSAPTSATSVPNLPQDTPPNSSTNIISPLNPDNVDPNEMNTIPELEPMNIPIIPDHFWVDSNGAFGSDFIILKNYHKQFLSCDCEGNLKSVNLTNGKLTHNMLWIPELMGDMYAFRSYYGGYITINADHSINCMSRTLSDNQAFEVNLTAGPNQEFIGTEKIQKYMTLKGYHDKVVGISENGKVSAEDKWENNGDLFTGINN